MRTHFREEPFFGGLIVYVVVRVLMRGFYTVRPDERAVVTSFGAAQKLEAPGSPPELTDDEKDRYRYPQLRVVQPGGPYFKWPWQRVKKVSVATHAVDVVWDPTKAQSTIEAVTKDNLTTGVNGQIRFRISENNLYAYLFGVSSPLEHVMGYFISVLRERIANFVDPKGQSLIATGELEGESGRSAVELSEGVSINDLRELGRFYLEKEYGVDTGALYRECKDDGFYYLADLARKEDISETSIDTFPGRR